MLQESMQYEISPIVQSGAEISVTIPFNEFEPFLTSAALRISENKEIKGFRKGKAPLAVVKEAVGESALYEEAAEIAVRTTYPTVLKKLMSEEKLSASHPPIGVPEIKITKIAPGNEFSYKATVAILPIVTLPDYTQIAKKKRGETQDSKVTDEEINSALNWIRESRAKIVATDRVAQNGDVVNIDFVTRKDRVILDGGSDRAHSFVLGKGKFIPGFEEAIVNMKNGETKDVAIDVPKDWRDENIAGKKLDFAITLNNVQERQIPEANDAFAQSLGKFVSLEELKKNITEGLIEEKKGKEKQRIRTLIIDTIAKEAKIEIPRVLTEKEQDKMMEEFKSSVEEMGMVWADYLSHLKKNETDMRSEWKGEAERRVRIGLTLNEIGVTEKINPTNEEVDVEANKYLASQERSHAARDQIDPERLREYTRGTIRNEKIFAFLETTS